MKLDTPEDREIARIAGAAVLLAFDVAARGMPLPGDTGPCSSEGRIERAFDLADKFLAESLRRLAAVRR